MKPASTMPIEQTKKHPGRNKHSKYGTTTRNESHKLHPASRNERLASWHRRMQLLFTRQTY